MKLLLTTIAAVVLVGCGESQQSAPAPETKPVEPVRQFGADVGMIVPVAEAAKIGPPTAKESIHRAAETGNIEAVKQHLAAGADVNAGRSDGGGTPLHFAAGWGHKEIAELLIEKGADLNAKSEGLYMHGWTPLHCAALSGHKEIVELLIAKGADINAKNRGEYTSFHFAAEGGHGEIVELLLAKGANVNAKNDGGETPLDRAIIDKQTETAALLRKHGGKTGEELKAEGK
jgi:ankyrin repeat protein